LADGSKDGKRIEDVDMLVDDNDNEEVNERLRSPLLS